MSPTTTPSKRYLSIANSLIYEISDGKYVVGSLLPTENELAEAHAVSRQTVRVALKLLQDRGYISRKKAVGSRVESTNPGVSYLQSVDTIEDLVHVAATEVRKLHEVTTVSMDRVNARRLGAPLNSEWVRFSCTRIDAKTETPVSWASIYIDAAFSAIIPMVREHPRILISAMLEKHCDQSIAEIRQTVVGTLIDAPLARLLGATEGGAALRILRHYKDAANRILEITETTYPAERVSVTFQLRRNKTV